MNTRLYYTSASGDREPIEELSVVMLTKGVSVESVGDLPDGSLGAVVFVHNQGEAYEVEFTEPFEAIVTLTDADFKIVEEATRERVIAASDDILHRQRKN